MESTKRIVVDLKSKPNQITAYDFETLKVQDGVLFVTTCAGDVMYSLDDLAKFTVW